MKSYKFILGVGCFALVLIVASVTTASAASVTLTNGGLGERSSDNSSFGISVCDTGVSAFSGSVPVVVAANGVTETVTVSTTLEVPSCAYAYLPYALFNMTAGNTYSITATIDPQHTIATNSNNQAIYFIAAVPPVPTSSSTVPSLPNAGVLIPVDLFIGNTGSNVIALQQFLIAQNKGPAAAALAQFGATGYFGVFTQAALAEFQASVGISPAQGYFGPITRAYLSEH